VHFASILQQSLIKVSNNFGIADITVQHCVHCTGLLPVGTRTLDDKDNDLI
jgi:hypothetical protein